MLKPIPYANFVVGGVVLNLVLIGLIFLFKNSLPPELPLFYGQPQGEGQLASMIYLILPSSLALGVTVVNVVVSRFTKDDFLKRVLIISALVVSAFTATTTIKIALLVGSF